MAKTKFAGSKRLGDYFLNGLEDRMVNKFAPLIPNYINGYNLTLISILWSLLIIMFSFFAQSNINWLWLVSLMIFFQWITDSFDGGIGRYRHSGLDKWGYYMDHFLDYIFLCSILIGYNFLVSDNSKYLLFFIFAIFSAFMVNTHLVFGAINELKVSYLKIGPPEMRILFIIVNTLLIIFGKEYLENALFYVLIASLLSLCVMVYTNQKRIFEIDIGHKKIK